MRLRRKRTTLSKASTEVLGAVGVASAMVTAAREALLAAAPTRRGQGVPVAEAVAAFEEHLRSAEMALSGWPAGRIDAERSRCEAAIAEALRRAEALRLHASPEGYEQLYVLLGEALDPLDGFDDAVERLRRGGS